MNTFANRTRKYLAAIVGTSALMVVAASAQTTTNAGVDAIVSAIDNLKPDMGTVVISAIALALIGIGAGVAISLGKKLMGK